MFPWNSDKVLRGIQPPTGEEGHLRRKPVRPASYSEHEEILQTPITAEGLKFLWGTMDKQSRGWDHDSKLLVKRLAHAAEKAFADRALLHTEDGRLLIQNDKKRSRKPQRARKVGSAKVTSYEDISKLRTSET
jgi:hypothetical protein